MSEQNTDNEAGAATVTSGSAGLEVAGEPGVYWCARHRRVKTRLRCGRCETPICPKCTIYGPTGARCRNCASYRGTHLYKISPLQLLMTFALSAILGIVGSLVIQWIFLLLFFAPALGGGLGNLITRVTGGKRGPVIASAASAGIATGTAAIFAWRWMSLQNSWQRAHVPATDMILMLSSSGAFYLLIFLVLAIAGVWYWLR